MNYEALYKEALEKIRKGIQPLQDGRKISGVTKGFLEEVFPELKESEDEQIRKDIIRVFKGETNYTSKEDATRYIAWLEKQGEQKPAWSEEDERIRQCLIRDQGEALDDVRNDKYGHSEIISDLKEMYRERIDWLKSLKL